MKSLVHSILGPVVGIFVAVTVSSHAWASEIEYVPGVTAVTSGDVSFVTSGPLDEKILRALYLAGFIHTVDGTCDFYSIERYEALTNLITRNIEVTDVLGTDSGLVSLTESYVKLGAAEIGAADAEAYLEKHGGCDSPEVTNLGGTMKPILDMLLEGRTA